MGERRWNGEGQREGVRVSSDVPHCSTMIKEAGGVMERRKLEEMDAGDSKERCMGGREEERSARRRDCESSTHAKPMGGQTNSRGPDWTSKALATASRPEADNRTLYAPQG